MPIYLQEDSKELNKQTYHLSQKGKQKLQAAISQMEAMGLEDKDGYKMLKHLQDEDYNQAKKKDDGKVVDDANVHTEKDKEIDSNDGVSNKTVEGGIHRNKVSTSKLEHYFTDWVYGRNGELRLQHKNAQNRLGHQAPKPTLPKKPKAPKPITNDGIKPINTKNGQIHIKEICLTTSQLKLIKERRAELNIPFKEFGSEENGYKLMYEHFIDYLENIGKYGKLQPSTISLDDITNNVAQIVETVDLERGLCIDSIRNMMDWIRTLGDNERYFTCGDEINNIDVNELSSEYLTMEGKTKIIKSLLACYGFPKSLTINENNLIYVERALAVPRLTSQEDVYNEYNKNFPQIGVCWSWAKNGGVSFGMDNIFCQDCIVLHGWVRPEDVDWVKSVEVNASELNNEMELRLKKDATVQIDEIICGISNKAELENKKLPLKNSILLPV